MVKKKIDKPRREVTRGQISRWQKETRRQRIILGIAVFIIVSVLTLVAGGWFMTDFRPLHETVIQVNYTKYDMDYFVKALKLFGKGQTSPYILAYLADELEKMIPENELMRQEAMQLGISVTEDEISAKLKSYNPPLSRDYYDFIRADLVREKLKKEYFGKDMPTVAEQRHVLAMFLESESQANDIISRLNNGEDFGALAGELSLDAASKNQKGDLGFNPKDVLTIKLGTFIPDDYAFQSAVGILSPPVQDSIKIKSLGYWLIKVLEKKDNGEVHVQAMLLSSQAEAARVKERIAAGEDFSTLAKELSQLDKVAENGGDLGWVTQGMQSGAFEKYVFDAQVKLNEVSEPIKDDAVATKGGYWLIKVLEEEENRKITAEDLNLLQSQALSDWLDKAEQDPSNLVLTYLTPAKKSWAVMRILG